ncbi:MAG: endopeptidase IV [Tatlockia sp.]|nr:endopeptidase IV [Tatlockia sp.]
MKTKLIKITLGRAFLLSLFAVGVAQAEVDIEKDKIAKEKEDNRPPIGCRETGFKFELQALHLLPALAGQKQSMYLFHNELGQTLNLYQMRSEESSHSTFLNHVIGPKEWGVFSTSEKQVRFICTTPDKKTPYGRVVDCGQSLLICEYTNVRYGLNNRGDFWLVNSNSRNSAVNSVVHYGIIPGN